MDSPDEVPAPAAPAGERAAPVLRATALPLPEPEQVPWRWAEEFRANSCAGPGARLRLRTRLTAASWFGDVETASQALDALVRGTIREARLARDEQLTVRAFILPTNELVLETESRDAATADPVRRQLVLPPLRSAPA
ncbi:hypothetical protein [Streptomyces abyssomicinicus]|uniref:hypothetical protein n=1 Tax=Streptomyces abyssomicinicus TaxID=574929 RepID=UPI00124FB386|nr:hypothetical protein [Streptomyces abyssomicinicus]